MVKISDLPAVAAPDGLELVPVVKDGVAHHVQIGPMVDTLVAPHLETIETTASAAALAAGTAGQAASDAEAAAAGALDAAQRAEALRITSFTDIAARTIPNAYSLVQTQGHAVGGPGAAYYEPFDLGSEADNAALAAAHPRAVCRSANGRYWRLSAGQDHRPDMFGALGGGADDSDALVALFAFSDRPHIGYDGEVWRTTRQIAVRSGQTIKGWYGKLERPDHTGHILALIDVEDVRIEGVRFSHNFPGGFIARGNKSAVYGLRASNVSVFDSIFDRTGLFAVSSDQSGPGWAVTLCRFTNIAGTAVDLRGTLADGTGKGFQVSKNFIDSTGDDAIAVAYFSQAGVIDGNIIFRAGQMVTYDLWASDGQLHQAGGGGIRFNGRQTVTNNQFADCNLFFISPATYSRNLSAAPNQAVVHGNVGRGIRPSINNSAACVLVKSVESVMIGANDFDARGDFSLAVTAVADNAAGKVRLTTGTPHGFYVGNRIRFENALGVGGEGACLAVIDETTLDLNLTWSASYSAAGTTCWPAVPAIRIYTDQTVVTAIADNGAGKVRVTCADKHGYVDGDSVRLADAGGIANGVSAVAVLDDYRFDMTGLALAGAWISGGTTWREAAVSRWVQVRGGRYSNCEHGLMLRGGAAQIIDLADVEFSACTYLTNPANNPQIAELLLDRITVRNPRALASGALFWGGGGATYATIAYLRLTHCRLVPGSYGTPDYPLDFTNLPITRAEVLRNYLAGAVNQFQLAGNILLLLFDGDWSERRHAAGSLTLSTGQAASSPISHGLPRKPRLNEIRLQKTTSGASVGGGALSVEYPTSTTFVIRCDSAPTAPLTVAWSIEPMVRPYINGTTDAQ